MFLKQKKIKKKIYHDRYLRWAVGILSFLMLLGIGLHGQTQAYAENKAYRLGARDVIDLKIYAGGDTQQEVTLTVSGEGAVNVPFIGFIHVEGKTISEVEEAITRILSRDFFVDPVVVVHISEYHSLRYFISGAIQEPGLYEMTSETTLLELIAKAGGVSPNRGNAAYILRDATEQMSRGGKAEDLLTNKEPYVVDLVGLLDKGDMRHNLLLQPGDVVYIPLQKERHVAESNIYVEGRVKNPGMYIYQPGLTALNACLMAGGFTKYAAPNRTRIIRKENDKKLVIKIDLNDVKMGEISDIELQPGDLIHVPDSWL